MEIKEAVAEVKAANETFKNDVKTHVDLEFAKLMAEYQKAQAVIEEQKSKMMVMGADLGEIKNVQDRMNAVMNEKFISLQGEKKSRTLKSVFEDMYMQHKDNIAKVAEGQRLEPIKLKVGNVSTSSLTTQNYATFLPWQPGMEPIGQFRIRSLIGTIPSDVDTVYFPRANSPVGLGSFGRQTTEGNAKAQVDRGWAMQTVTLTTFAAYLIASRQSLRNIVFMQAWLPTSLNEQMLDAEDLDYANQLVAGATGSNSTTGAASVAIEQIIFLIKNLIATKFYPNAVALDPTKWAAMLITKPQNYSLPNAVVIGPDGMVRILGRPVYPANWLTGGRTLIGDFTKAAIVQSEDYTFRQSDSHASTFIANQVTFLLERTANIVIFRPDAFVTGILS